MKKTTIYSLSLFISIPLFVAGATFKVLHLPIEDILFKAGLTLNFIAVIMGLIDVTANKELKWYERTMWVSAFVLLQPIAGILYLPKYKQRNP